MKFQQFPSETMLLNLPQNGLPQKGQKSYSSLAIVKCLRTTGKAPECNPTEKLRMSSL